MKIHLITIALFTLGLTSCGTPKKAPMNKTDSYNLKQNFWVLETLDGEIVYEIGNTDREIGFKLDVENNRISGYGGCNNFMGDFNLKAGNRISFSNLGSTKMSCPDLSFNESQLLNVFEMADNYRIVDGRLELYVGKKAPLAIFRKAVDRFDRNAEHIVEKYWKLKSLNGEDVKMGDNQEREVYFTLKTQDNRVVGFAGCNNITGTYTLGIGNRIRFSQMATTLKICPDVDFKEHEFLKVFELTNNYTLNGDELLLNVDKKAPLAAFEAVYMD